MAADLEAVLHPQPLAVAEIPVHQTIQLPGEGYTSLNIEHEDPGSTNWSIYLYIQCGPCDEVLDAKSNFLGWLLDETDRHWHEITNRMCRFTRLSRQIALLKTFS